MRRIALWLCLALPFTALASEGPPQDRSELGVKSFSPRLKLPKETIMAGEPLEIAFIVENHSEEEGWLLLGGDYRNRFGRPTSFQVTVTDSTGTALPERDAGFTVGGLMGFQQIPAKGEISVPLFLPHWTLIEEPGRYRIQVKRELVINSRNAIADLQEDEPGARPLLRITAEVAADLTVIPREEEGMGRLIERLGREAVADPHGRSMKYLEAIDDERTVFWLKKVIWEGDPRSSAMATRALGSQRSSAAVAELRKIISRTTASEDELQAAVYALTISPNPDALLFLLSQSEHQSAVVRLSVANVIRKSAFTAGQLPLLEKLSRDENATIREAASQYLMQLRDAGK